VVQAAEADVVGPSVAAQNPHALANQRVGDGQQVARFGRVVAGQLLAQREHALALLVDLGSVFCGRVRIAATSSSPISGASRVTSSRQTPSAGRAPRPHAEAELGVVFKQRVGPRRPAPSGVLGVRRGGQVAAVDRRAAGGVGDIHAVAEELRQQLDVRRLAAARAGAGELKQRLQQLHVLHLRVRELGLRSTSGSLRKKSQLARSDSRSGGCGAMLMAFLLASLLLFTGQTSTQSAQPVQSSGATCSV
jgi:hypothetical protein